MSFFKSIKNRLTPPKANISLKLNKTSFALGENVEGTLTISSSEDIQATEIRCEIECVEETKTTTQVWDEAHRTYVTKPVSASATLYSGKPTLSGPLKMSNGYTGSFPLSTNIPAGGRPTYKSVNDNIAWSIKGVIAIDGRPDVTSTKTEIQVLQQSAAPAGPVTKEVIREVVLIPCKYCGALMQQTETACPHCGGKRTV